MYPGYCIRIARSISASPKSTTLTVDVVSFNIVSRGEMIQKKKTLKKPYCDYTITGENDLHW